MASTSMRTANYRAPRAAAAAGEPLALVAATLLGVALVAAALQLDHGAHPGSDVAIAVGALACLTVIMAGPVPCLMTIGALTAAGLSPSLVQIGGIDITLVDVFFGGLVVWCLWESLGRAQQIYPERPRVAFGQFAAILFLGYAGLSLWHIYTSEHSALSASLVSWVRLAQTASLAWLASTVLETKRDVQLLIGAIAVGGVVAVVIAASSGGAVLIDRSGGTLGPDTLGLVASLLLLIAVFGVPKTWRIPRAVLIVAGIAGLVLGKSVGSSIAVAIAFAVGAALKSETATTQRMLRAVLTAALAGIVVVGMFQVFRPEQIPGSQQFKYSSTYSRIVVGAVGLEIFERHPVFGVGWRGSNSPTVIGDRELNIDVRRALPGANPIFYPDVTPTSVHNTFIQILADLGLVGFALFVGLIVTVGMRTHSLLKRLGQDHELWPLACVSALGLLLAVVWYNDNPLYGGQPETVLPALLVACLVAISRLVAPRPALPAWSTAPGGAVVSAGPAFGGRSPEAGALSSGRPLLRAGAGRRLGWAAAIIAVSAGVGLVAGLGTGDQATTPSAADLAASAHYDKVLNRDVANLSAARTGQLALLQEAQTPADQASATTGLADAYQRAVDSLARVAAPASLQASKEAAVSRLQLVADAYRRLAAAAESVDPAAYDAARRAVERAEANLPPSLRSQLIAGR